MNERTINMLLSLASIPKLLVRGYCSLALDALALALEDAIVLLEVDE